jgi:hypothetical protein
MTPKIQSLIELNARLDAILFGADDSLVDNIKGAERRSAEIGEPKLSRADKLDIMRTRQRYIIASKNNWPAKMANPFVFPGTEEHSEISRKLTEKHNA